VFKGRLIQDLVVGLIYLGAALSVVAYVFSAPVGTLIATSGVFAIILGLALQSTLADVFSGIALNLSRAYTVGDWIVLAKADAAIATLQASPLATLHNQRVEGAAFPNMMRAGQSPNPDRRMSPGSARQPKVAMPRLAATNTKSMLAPRRRASAPPATAINARKHAPMTGHLMCPVPCPTQ
jgi:hypothetical protein